MTISQRFFATRCALLFGVLLVFLHPSLAAAQSIATANPAPQVALGQTIDRGRQLETERRWGEALVYYEDALRQFPGDGSLKQRFSVARLHFDLGRRYSDRSYRDLLHRMPVSEALDLYNEVLLKIQTHYVEAPHWKELVANGTRDLDVALTEPTFLATNAVKSDQISSFRQELQSYIESRSLQNRTDARDAVAAIARLGQQRLGTTACAVVLEYVCGAANSLDQYSSCLTPSQLAEVYSQIDGNFVGLGVELKAQDGGLLIVRVISGSPAKRAGIRDGDRITSVAGRSIRDISSDRAADMLQGEVGSTVELTVESPGQAARQVRVRRERVDVPSVDEVQILDRVSGVAYMKLTCFQKTTSRDLEAALWKLHRDGMRSLVIDVRGNPGGLLLSSVEIADLFIDRGVIVMTRGRGAQEDFTYSAHEAGTWHMPLAVLVDQDSASAAEIFAGAIRDHRRGTVVGTRTYGKGSVQGIFPLNVAGAGLRLTTAKFYSPNGHAYAGVGVEPEITVRSVAKPTASASPSAVQDPVLAAGIQAIQQQAMAQR